MSHGVEGRNSAAAVDRDLRHDSHGGVLLEEAVDHVEQHIRLGFPEPASAKRARSR